MRGIRGPAQTCAVLPRVVPHRRRRLIELCRKRGKVGGGNYRLGGSGSCSRAFLTGRQAQRAIYRSDKSTAFHKQSTHLGFTMCITYCYTGRGGRVGTAQASRAGDREFGSRLSQNNYL